MFIIAQNGKWENGGKNGKKKNHPEMPQNKALVK